MKTLKVLLLALIAQAVAVTSHAQATSIATATANIIKAISIGKKVDMSFGNIAVSSSGGTVILTPASERKPDGGITLPTDNGTVNAASFTVTGSGALTFSITLPTEEVILINDKSERMFAKSFTSDPISDVAALENGEIIVSIGATLVVSGSQAEGVYTAYTRFPVTVNYN